MYEEGEYVSADEDFGEPSCSNWSEGFAVSEEDQTAENHINACCEQGRCNQKKEGLHDVDTEIVLITVGNSTANVSDAFDCG